ncbi:MAG: TIGR02266 family protein [Acidobacteriota bacterium]
MTQLPFDYSNIPRDSRRVPLATKVSFKFERFSGFISEFSANISPTGMYITTKTPEPPGNLLDFEFRLGDGFEIIQGKGEVVWTRAIAEGPNRPPGMGIRFLELSEGSKELIYRIVDQYIQDGGTPFDVSLRPPDPVPVVFPEPAPPPVAPRAAPVAPAAPIAAPPSPPPPAAASPFPDLPDSGVLPPVDTSNWLPELPRSSRPALSAEDSAFGAPASSSLDDDFPPFMPLPPIDDEPEPVRPTLSFGGMAAASAPEKKSRVLPLAIVGLVLALAAAGWLFRDTLLGMVGLGGGETVAAADMATPMPGPPVRPQAAPAAAPTPQQEEGTVIQEEDTPLPEVVRRREPDPAAAGATPIPTPAPTPALPPAGPALTILEKVTFEQAFGGTDIVLQGNGAMRPESYDQSRLGDPPREMIRLIGIARPFSPAKVPVGTGEVKQVRMGYHEKSSGNELHVVIDLASAGVKVTRIEAKDNQLRIHLQRQ